MTDDEKKPGGVPLVRRLFFGVLGREGMRRDELGSLRWRDRDLERGHVMLDENKTDDPRSWALDSGVTRALKMRKEGHCKDAKVDDHVFVDPADGAPVYTLHLADQLREDCGQPASPVPRSASAQMCAGRSGSTTSAPRSSPSAWPMARRRHGLRTARGNVPA